MTPEHASNETHNRAFPRYPFPLATSRFLLPATVLLLASLSACVPSRKYAEADQRYQAAERARHEAESSLQQADADLKDKEATLSDLRTRKERLERDTLTLGTSLRNMTTQYDKINAQNKALHGVYRGSSIP